MVEYTDKWTDTGTEEYTDSKVIAYASFYLFKMRRVD
jgi:hypothetical protein